VPVIPAAPRLLVETAAGTDLAALTRSAQGGPGHFEALSDAAAADGASRWAVVTPPPAKTSEHPWDVAHRSLADPGRLGLAAGPAPEFVEPDLVQRFPYQVPANVPGAERALTSACVYRAPSPDWPPGDYPFAWHLEDDFAGLRAARDKVGDPGTGRVRVMILDTGYDPEHDSVPAHLDDENQRNFTGSGDSTDATDPGRHWPLDNPGHGTATLALLAGNRVARPGATGGDFLGGAPQAEVIPVRIANSVIHFYTSSMARGIGYAADLGVAVVSVSMGGLPTQAWAVAVNRAYEAGVAVFAAAGNRIGVSPPRSIVYPARFNRVVAVCGATYDRTPYYKPGVHFLMQGCFGPPAKMATAIAAFTPNTPWASCGCRHQVSHDGAGTSAATPQAAAAAALWLQNAGAVAAQPWQRVEAVRHALFASADKSAEGNDVYYGQGLLRARHALDVPFRTDLPQTPADSVSFPWLRLGGRSAAEPSGHELMYEVEALQVFEQDSALQELAGGADPLRDDLDRASRRRLVATLAKLPGVSDALRRHAAAIQDQL
jgi:hypothetical protein